MDVGEQADAQPSSAGGSPETGSVGLGDAELMALVARRRTRAVAGRRAPTPVASTPLSARAAA